MMKNRIPTVTVGVSAHNESENILYLLRSILKQKGPSFILNEILVISDGSTDGTAEKITAYAQKHPEIKVLCESQRKGKVSRVRQIFSMAQSDFIFIFDADIVLSDNSVVEKMAVALSNQEKYILVSAALKPIEIKGLPARVIAIWTNTWKQLTQNYNQGDFIYNAHSSAYGIKSSFAKQVIFPKSVVDEAQYLYLLSKSRYLSFFFVPSAVVLYRIPKSIREYLVKIQKQSSEKLKLISLFGSEIKQAYNISALHKAKTTLFSIIKNPLNLFIIPFMSIIKSFPFGEYESTSSRSWSMPRSSKRKIHSY